MENDNEKKPIVYFNMDEQVIKNSIEDYLDSNSNEDGLDLSKVYLAKLTYTKNLSNSYEVFEKHFGINCPINYENDPKKMTLVYIYKTQGENDHIYLDIINKTILQSTCVNIEGWSKIVTEYRKGVTVSQIFPLDKVVGLDRLYKEDLGFVYNCLGHINNYSTDPVPKLHLP